MRKALRRGLLLLTFSTDTPGRTRTIGKVQQGLAGDRSLIGIDYRVRDGRLYGVGGNGGISTLSTADASASKVGQLTVGLVGTSFGVDFNPAANRLRVVSDTGQNLRHNLDDATATTPPLAGMTQNDGTLTIPPATTPAAGVTGATNNDLDAATATTLFDIDTRRLPRRHPGRRPRYPAQPGLIHSAAPPTGGSVAPPAGNGPSPPGGALVW